MGASSLHRCRLLCARDLPLLFVPTCQRCPRAIRRIRDLLRLNLERRRGPYLFVMGESMPGFQRLLNHRLEEERVKFVVSLKDINDLPPDWGLSTHTQQADRHCSQIVNSRPYSVPTINAIQPHYAPIINSSSSAG